MSQGIAVLNFLTSRLKKIRDVIVEPPAHHEEFSGPSVHRDDAIADAIAAAVSSGTSMAQQIRTDLNVSALGLGLDVASALDTPLAVIDGGNGDTEHGSLLRAICVGASAAVELSELYINEAAANHARVLHFMLANGIAEWEVGREDVGRPPSALHEKGPGRANREYRSFLPGELTGGKISVAHMLMQNSGSGRPESREQNARFIAQTIISSLGLALDPYAGPPENSVLHKLGLDKGQPILPQSAIDTVAERVLAVDLFWPSYLEGKQVVC
jgi:hypothetical protein